MRCAHCDQLMRPETVIRLHRRFGRIRATQSQAAYCATCKLSVPLACAPASPALRQRWLPARLALWPRARVPSPGWTHA